MTRGNTNSIRKIATAATRPTPPGTTGAADRRGVEALADVCRGLFGGSPGQLSRRSTPSTEETVEIVISMPGGPSLASAA